MTLIQQTSLKRIFTKETDVIKEDFIEDDSVYVDHPFLYHGVEKSSTTE
jgi:hypothetical protein